MSFRQGARQFFERRGAPTPPLPYDAEVEYIERDFTVPWVVDGIETARMGFSLDEYVIAGETLGTARDIFCAYSITPQSSGNLCVAASLRGGTGSTEYGLIAQTSNSVGYYGGKSGGAAHSSGVAGVLGIFHTVGVARNAGEITMSIDDSQFYSTTTLGATVLNKIVVLYCNSSSVSVTGGCKMRVKSVRIGSDVDLLPVKKGNRIGFYNKVDGHLFLEEQACLSAGPKV